MGEKGDKNGQVEFGELTVKIKVNRGMNKTVLGVTRPSEAVWNCSRGPEIRGSYCHLSDRMVAGYHRGGSREHQL